MFNKLYFICKLCFIFTLEVIEYGLEQDYHRFIRNMIYNLYHVNILCSKLFQAMSLNIDKTMNDELIQYTDNVPFTLDADIDYIKLIDLAKEENMSIDILNPINSGMISLVYKTRQQNGKYVIIKIKRKNIEQKLEESIDNILFLYTIISKLGYFLSFFWKNLNIHDFKMGEVIQKNVDLIKQQLDFQNEVKNMQEMKELYKNNNYVKIPEVYAEITDKYPNIIMMEYIEGNTISKVIESDYEIYAKQIFTFIFSSIFIKGTIHGDLHSGNILFMKKKRELGIEGGIVDSEYQIGILDFGLVYKIDEEFKHKFAELFIDVYVKPAKEIAANILEIGILEPIESIHNLPEKHRTNIIEMIAEMVDDVFHKTGKGDQVKIFEILIQLNDYFNKYNLTEYDIHISKNFLKIQMIMAMSQGIGIMLCKEKHIAMINQVTREIFHLDLIE